MLTLSYQRIRYHSRFVKPSSLHLMWLPLTLVGCRACDCDGNKPLRFDICLLIDVTERAFQEEKIYESALDDICKRMDIDKLKNGGRVRLQLINDISEDRFKVIELQPDERGLMSKAEMDRLDEVAAFKKMLKQQLSDLVAKATWNKEKSLIYQPICRVLNDMAHSTTDLKALLVFSDMLENSELFSFYGARGNSLTEEVNNEPARFVAKIENISGCTLPNLADVEIHFVCWRTVENDKLVNDAEKLWKSVFSTRKGSVKHFSSTLQFVN